MHENTKKSLDTSCKNLAFKNSLIIPFSFRNVKKSKIKLCLINLIITNKPCKKIKLPLIVIPMICMGKIKPLLYYFSEQ